MFKSYLDYPCYGHRGRFINLKPPNHQNYWNESQVRKFLIQFANTSLFARVVRFDTVDQCFELDIFELRGQIEVNLREWLLRHCLCDSFLQEPHSIRPMCYYFPTFDMLESNYPTFHEKSVMEANGIDFDLLVETDNYSCTDSKTLISTPKLLSMLGRPKFKKAKNLFFPPACSNE